MTAPIPRSVYWIASTHVGHTCSRAFVALIPFCCLVRMFDDEGLGSGLTVVDWISSFLLLTVPLLIGMSMSFAFLRRKAIIERAGPPFVASSAVFSALGAGVIGLIEFKSSPMPLREHLLIIGTIFADCGIFSLLTRLTFKKMEVADSHGFPVVFRRQEQ